MPPKKTAAKRRKAPAKRTPTKRVLARANGAEENKDTGVKSPQGFERLASETAAALFTKRCRFDFTCRVPDPRAFALDLEANLMRLLRKELVGSCYQRMYILTIDGYIHRGGLIAVPSSLAGEFKIDVVGVTAVCWIAQPGDLVLGRVRTKMTGGTFVEGDAPTRYIAQVMDYGEVPAAALTPCPVGTLLPLRIYGMEYTPWKDFASGTVVLAGPEPTLEVAVVDDLTPEEALALLPLVEMIEKRAAPTGAEAFFARLFRLTPEPAGDRVDLGAAIRAAAAEVRPGFAGRWRYSPSLGLRMPRLPDTSEPTPTTSAAEFCRLVVRRVLLCQHTIGLLGREYAEPKRRSVALSVWKAMEAALV